MTERVDQYQRNAEKCFELAQSFNDPNAKRTMRVMADAWLLLAARINKIGTAPANETPSPVNQPPPCDEPPKPPPVNEPPPLRLNPDKPDDPMQC